MGATTFSTYGLGRTPEEAFRQAVERAQWEYGHGGYTGTIAEKSHYVLFIMPPRLTVDRFFKLIHEVEDFDSLEWLRSDLQYARNKTDLRKREADLRKEERRQAAFWRKHATIAPFLKQVDAVYCDKWGPAVALKINGSKAAEVKKRNGRSGTRDQVFLFCGWASC